MALITLKTDPNHRQIRQFAAVWFPAFWMVVGWFMWTATASMILVITLALAVLVVSVLGFLMPRWMRYIYLAWMMMAFPIGWLIGHLLLATIYYVVLTPIGLLLRASGRDPLERRFDRSATTYWQPHQGGGDVARYFRQY